MLFQYTIYSIKVIIRKNLKFYSYENTKILYRIEFFVYLTKPINNQIMDINVFLNNYREAFGEKVDLPIVFWYSEQPVNSVDKIGGCLFKCPGHLY